MHLYHFPTSPFARRVRLALAHKGLAVELRDARADAAHQAELRRIHPMHTVPVLVDGDRVVRESNAILHYLDRKWPDPPLWPAGVEGVDAIETCDLADAGIQILADLGLRYVSLATHPEFPAVREAAIGRVQRVLDSLAARAERASGDGYLHSDRWSAADMATYTLTAWLNGLPARAEVFPPARGVLALGWSVPASLTAWAARHRDRADVTALDPQPR